MSYTIGQVSELTGLSIHTLRYYENEGILSPITRNEVGLRIYQTKDIEALEFIGCLKAIGMTIKDIKHFVHVSTAIDQRLSILEKQKENVNAQINQLLSYQSIITRKIELYMKMRCEEEMSS
ncbi:MerR family transcriptional regulator [Brevibacillus choshinensis]|uniref:MerR family transcriptional regulator n=1 Tax=Brevibacillus choshinensis TaxID=54911 RepID=UPI002E1D7C5B|nr:MerR family transcriptional regulator [Brevibacillus choshinensis]